MPLRPTVGRSRELEDPAPHLIATCDEFEPTQTAIHEAGLSVEWVWETKPFDPMKDEYKPHVIAKVTKASPLWLSLADTHLVVQFRRWCWERFDDTQRRAVLHHELTHIEVDEPDEQGRIPIKLRHHDVEDFTRTMRRFGPVIPGRAAFVKAYVAWSAEHPATQHQDAFGHKVAEAVAERINAGDLGPDVTATVTHSGRVVDPETGEILG